MKVFSGSALVPYLEVGHTDSHHTSHGVNLQYQNNAYNVRLIGNFYNNLAYIRLRVCLGIMKADQKIRARLKSLKYYARMVSRDLKGPSIRIPFPKGVCLATKKNADDKSSAVSQAIKVYYQAYHSNDVTPAKKCILVFCLPVGINFMFTKLCL